MSLKSSFLFGTCQSFVVQVVENLTVVLPVKVELLLRRGLPVVNLLVVGVCGDLVIIYAPERGRIVAMALLKG